MKKNEICKDAYGLNLKIGDVIIPIVSDSITEGIISNIEFKHKLSFITIIDEKGNILHENVLSYNYTTKERYNEKEYSNVILWINFHSDKGYAESKIPLNSGTKTDFSIPKNTMGISISYDKYDEDYECYSEELFFFGLNKKITVNLDKDLDEMIITIKENGKKDWINKDAIIKLFNSFNELKKDLFNTIETIKTNNLDDCNKIIPYEDNILLQETIKKLTRK